MEEKRAVIYLAGGCFWGLQKLMGDFPGVKETRSGYANGTGPEDACYEKVCGGRTGFRETVEVVFDPEAVSLDAILLAYFQVIDPTARNRQGPDIGTQYQAGIYWTDRETAKTVERIADLERGRTPHFAVELGPLRNFFPAEEYHQNYLGKHPGGYCHISPRKIREFSRCRIDPGDYRRPPEETLRERLTEEQYRVVRHAATEPPFQNAYWDFFEEGIYVDAATGEPLFSSRDKFPSACGWPAFSRPIEPPAVVEREDFTAGMYRMEVRSRAGDSHLGHVFTGELDAPDGTRYCINSAALRFIPRKDLEREGYGALLDRFRDEE